MKTWIKAACSLAALLILPGCLDSETTVNVNKDGSGTVVQETILGAQMMAMFGQLGALGGEDATDPLDEMFSPDNAQKTAASMGEGVTFDKIERIERGAARGARVTYRFEDVNKLKLNPAGGLEGMAPEVGEQAEAADPITFTFADGKLTIHQPQNLDEEGGIIDGLPEMPEDGEDPQMKAMMEQMMAEMKVAVRVTVAPGIKQTNATHREGNTVTLMEMQFGELLKQEGALEKLSTLNPKDKEAAKAAIKGIKGIKVDLNEVIEIEFE